MEEHHAVLVSVSETHQSFVDAGENCRVVLVFRVRREVVSVRQLRPVESERMADDLSLVVGHRRSFRSATKQSAVVVPLRVVRYLRNVFFSFLILLIGDTRP